MFLILGRTINENYDFELKRSMTSLKIKTINDI